MAGRDDTGLRGALALDQAADDLNSGRAGGAENRPAGADGPDREAEQLAMFSGSSVFGTVREPGGKTHAAGPGRPRGARNRATKDLVKLIEATGRHPLLAMAEIVATPIDVIAATLGCKKIEAAEYHRKVMSDLAPYVAQKLPTAVQIAGANAGMLVINLGGGDPGRAGLDLKLAAEQVAGPLIDHQQNQRLSEDDDEPSHDDPSHDEAK
ncbi:MAG: hypothetical protein ABJG86_11155 [Nitratireductor sp.]